MAIPNHWKRKQDVIYPNRRSVPISPPAKGKQDGRGWYLRVLEPGTVQEGDAWTLERAAAEGAPSIAEVWQSKRGGS